MAYIHLLNTMQVFYIVLRVFITFGTIFTTDNAYGHNRKMHWPTKLTIGHEDIGGMYDHFPCMFSLERVANVTETIISL